MYKLREIEKNDIAIINSWRRDRKLQNLLGGGYRFVNQDVDMDWYENYLKSRSTNVRCAILNETNEIIGVAYLLNINYINSSGEIHIMIGDIINRGKGAGLFAITEMCKHGFYDLNLNRIELEVIENNTNAIHLYSKIGFVQEGIKRKALYKNGSYVNVVLMSLLKEDFIV